MKLDKEILSALADKFGDAFYILDIEKLILNFRELKGAFSRYYPNFDIAYSYKTNYTPAICREIERLGGYAEVVSEMEYELAKRIGVAPGRIILNGPVKSRAAVCELLLSGGQVNIESENELEILERVCAGHRKKKLRVGIRCNYDISDGVISRFGIDTGSPEFERVLRYIKKEDCLTLSGLHCHFAQRNMKAWKNRVSGMLELIRGLELEKIESIDFGGGLYGKMGDSLKEQFPDPIPCFEEYAEAVAGPLSEYYRDDDEPPKLLVEPGSAIVGDVMSFAARVTGIKTVRGKPIATLNGSVYNINPTLNGKNLPFAVYHQNPGPHRIYKDIDLCGYTCVENDRLFRGYSGELDVGDWAIFENVGSYSVVMKPPFIFPNVPIIRYDGRSGGTELVKSAETFDDIFRTYSFDEICEV